MLIDWMVFRTGDAHITRPLFEGEGGGSGEGGSGDAGASDAGAADGGEGKAGDANANGGTGEAGKDNAAQPANRTAFADFGKGTDKAEEGKEEGDETGAQDDAETGAFEVAIPEGFEGYQAEFEGYQGAANSYLTENPNATARDALAWAAKHQTDAIAKAGTDLRGDFESMVSGWETEAKADPDIGGAKYTATIASAMEAVKSLGSQEFAELLNDTGIGASVHTLRFLSKVGEMVKESPILGGEASKGEVSFAAGLYGKKGR